MWTACSICLLMACLSISTAIPGAFKRLCPDLIYQAACTSHVVTEVTFLSVCFRGDACSFLYSSSLPSPPAVSLNQFRTVLIFIVLHFSTWFKRCWSTAFKCLCLVVCVYIYICRNWDQIFLCILYILYMEDENVIIYRQLYNYNYNVL